MWQITFMAVIFVQMSKGQNLLYFRKPDITEGSEARGFLLWEKSVWFLALSSKVSGIKYSLPGDLLANQIVAW